MNQINLLKLILISVFFICQTSHAISLTKLINVLKVEPVGQGCDSTNVSSSISPDRKDISVLFDQMILESKADESSSSKMTIKRKVCNILVTVLIPSYLQIKVKGADFRGFASLSDENKAAHKVIVPFQKSKGYGYSYQILQAPFSSDFSYTNRLVGNTKDFSPCGQRIVKLVISNQISLLHRKDSTEDSIFSIDSMDFSLKQSKHVEYKVCTRSSAI